jgi:hypothetical protein
VNGREAGCLCAFFSIFFLLGCISLLMMVWTLVLPEVRANTLYVPNLCVVLDKKMSVSQGENGPTYRPEVRVRYTVAGRVYQRWAYDAGRVYSSDRDSRQAILDRFEVGRKYPCWHDPDAPARVVLVRGYSWSHYFFILIPLIFIAVGAAGMYFALALRGKSPERLAAARSIRRQAKARASGVVEAGPVAGLANVPEIDLANSPGATLSFQLPVDDSTGCSVTGILLFTLIWNGFTAYPVVETIQGHLEGAPSWWLTILSVFLVLLGLFFIGVLVKQVRIALAVGPTVVEISDHPLRPGGRYEVFVSQSGRRTMNSLSVALTCEESAAYRQGTDTRTEKRVVCEVEVMRFAGLAIEDGLPFEARRPLVVPPGAMHSFQAQNNQVVWKLVVAGDISRGLDFRREFPVVVHPAPEKGVPT